MIKPKLYKNNIEISCSEINSSNLQKLSLVFDLSPQDKAESCIDYIRYSNQTITVFDFDSPHSNSYKFGTKKYQEYIDLLKHFGYNDIENDIISFNKLTASKKPKP